MATLAYVLFHFAPMRRSASQFRATPIPLPNELFLLHSSIALAVAMPGALLLWLSPRAGTTPSHARRAERIGAIGWLTLGLAALYVIAMFALTSGARGPGGLGSQGNPLAALVMLGYAFFIAPSAWIAAIVAIAIQLRR